MNPWRFKTYTASKTKPYSILAEIACMPAAWSNAEFASFSYTVAETKAPKAWDAHDDLKKNHDLRCAETDKPIAWLLTDLKNRGLLDSTLVIWVGEFGRTPTAESGKGRDHHARGFNMWMAGGGIRGGTIHGATDKFGYHAVENKVSVSDLHATILHLLGLDHKKLTYCFMGRNMLLTDVSGEVIKPILA